MQEPLCSMVISCDESLCSRVLDRLGQLGLRATACGSGSEALRRVANENPALVVLDLSLQDVGGLDVCREIAAPADRRVVVLVEESHHYEGVMSLELGADDYMRMPFDDLELVARVRALLRRLPWGQPAAPGEPRLRISFHPSRPLVYLRGRPIRLRKPAHRLLGFLLDHVGDVCTKEELRTAVWGGVDTTERSLAPQVSYLRHLLEADPRHPRHLLTVRDLGYTLQDATSDVTHSALSAPAV